MRTTLVLAVAVLLAGCADPVPTAPVEQDVAGKQFAPPPAGMAALYVYRPRAGNNALVSVGQRTIGSLQGGYWMRVDLPPGRYDMRCLLPAVGPETSTMVDLSAGQITYIAASERFTPGWGCYLELQAPAAAQSVIVAGHRALER